MRRALFIGICAIWPACAALSEAAGPGGTNGIGSGRSTPPAGGSVGAVGTTGATGAGGLGSSSFGAGSITPGPSATLGNSGSTSGGNLGTGTIGGSAIGNSALGNSNLGTSSVGGATNAPGTFQGQGSTTGSFGTPFPGQNGTTFQGPAGAAGNATAAGANQTGQTAPQGAAGTVLDQNTNPGVIGQGNLGALPNQTGAANNNWRWRFFNGMWWYWMPATSQWMYFQNGSWQFFNGPVEGINPAQSQPQTQAPYVTGYRGPSTTGSLSTPIPNGPVSGVGPGTMAPGNSAPAGGNGG